MRTFPVFAKLCTHDIYCHRASQSFPLLHTLKNLSKPFPFRVHQILGVSTFAVKCCLSKADESCKNYYHKQKNLIKKNMKKSSEDYQRNCCSMNQARYLVKGKKQIFFYLVQGLTWGRFHKELGLILSQVRRVTRLNLGFILKSACYSAGLGLVLSPKISLKLGRVL